MIPLICVFRDAPACYFPATVSFVILRVHFETFVSYMRAAVPNLFSSTGSFSELIAPIRPSAPVFVFIRRVTALLITPGF